MALSGGLGTNTMPGARRGPSAGRRATPALITCHGREASRCNARPLHCVKEDHDSVCDERRYAHREDAMNNDVISIGRRVNDIFQLEEAVVRT